MKDLFTSGIIRVEEFEPSKLVENTQKKSQITNQKKRGFHYKDKLVIVVPSEMKNSKVDRGILILSAKECYQFMKKFPLTILGDADENSTKIPAIFQRIPNKDRCRKIIRAWADKKQSYEGKTESIELYVYGSQIINEEEIHLGSTSLVAIGDGGGRMTSLMYLFETEGEDNICVTNDIHFQLNFNFSGNPSRQIKNFLNINRDVKRVTKGTQLSSEIALINIDHDGNNKSEIGLKTIKEWTQGCHAEPYIVDNLYKRLDDYSGDTVLRMLPWQFEGKRSTSDGFFMESGESSRIATALKELFPKWKTKTVREMNMDELEGVLWVGFQNFARLCSNIDAKKSRLNSTLSFKLMITLILFFHEEVHDFRKFDKKLRGLFTLYKESYIKEFEKNKSFKHISVAEFYQENKWFIEDGFNSGAKATQLLFKQLNIVYENYCRIEN